MKKAAVLFALLALAVLVTACGGGGADPAVTSGTPAGATGTPAGGTAIAPPPEPVVPRAFEVKPTTPDFFGEALKLNQPLVVLFYGEDMISQDVLAEVKKLYEDKNYEGAVEFLLLKVDGKEEITKLMKEFSVSYIPYVAVLTRSGEIIFEKKGYLDSKLIEQAVYNAVNK